MIGAIVTVAVCALLSSGLATLGNHAIAREFPNVDLQKNAALLTEPTTAVRYAEYRLATNIFYRQSLVLWTVLALLVVYMLGLPLLGV